MLTDIAIADAARRSGMIRSHAAQSGMRGLGSSCCGSCAGTEDLGDVDSIVSTIKQSKALDALFLVSLAIGAVAGGISIYDHFNKKRKRRRHAPRQTSRTMQIPVQTMRDLVYGDDQAA